MKSRSQCPLSSPAPDEYQLLTIEEAFAVVERQVRRLVVDHPRQFPTYTKQGRWVFADDPWAPTWSSGFLTGMIWALAVRTGDEWWLTTAREYSRLLEPRAHDLGTHDIGFIFDPSWGRWLAVEPTPQVRQVLVAAGRTMAKRLQAPGGYLSTWVDPGSTFIDVMMNVGIIFRAAKLTGDDSLFQAALQHCRTTRRYLQRGDGSTAHEGWFDPNTGEFLRTATHQGWRSDSTWARGQAWAIYGFTTAYRYTQDEDFLDAACRAANYYIEHTPQGVPPNDWQEPTPALPYESSAAAIAAAGMLHLAEALSHEADRRRFRQFGLDVLIRLRSTDFLAVDHERRDGVLQHAIYHQRHQLGIDESVMWGDYYFVEALEAAERSSALPAPQEKTQT